MTEFYQISDLRNWKERTKEISPPIRLGVIGVPIGHSLSPQMQNAALKACGIEMGYTAFHIRPNELEEALQLLKEHQFIGVNLTVPHKISGLSLMDEVDGRGKQIGAINTVVFREDRAMGYNTDAPGFGRAIREVFSVDLSDLRVLLLGAGGAGRAVAWQCALENCERLVLVNRTLARAQMLARELANYFVGPRVLGPEARLEAVAWEERILRQQLARTDLVINATPLGLSLNDPVPLSRPLIAPHLMVYDLIPQPTPFLSLATEAGARGADGRSMLLHQGALAFELWFNQRAPIGAMRQALS